MPKITHEPVPVPKALSVKQFCEATGISHSHFFELQRDGKIKSVLIGTRRIIPGEEYQRIMRDGTEGAQP
jgi:predicted site-specific integrase-resolvase